MNFKCDPTADVSGTSFCHVMIDFSTRALVAMLGKAVGPSSDGKVTHEWVFVGDDGSVCTLYDYYGDPASDIQGWHVGGPNKACCQAFKAWFWRLN